MCVCFFSQVLRDMDMLSEFTSILHVPNLSQPEHIMAVLDEYDLFNKQELNSLAKKLKGHKYDFFFIEEIISEH